MYLITHVFSRRNSGDGLLVDLTLEALAEAGVPREACCTLALDASSFADIDNVVQALGEPTAQWSPRLGHAALALASDMALEPFGKSAIGVPYARLFAEAEAIIAVGGGYLVADSAVRQAGVFLNHLLQIRMAGRSQAPTIYMPQSIGPLEGPAGLLCRKALEGIDRIYLRDNESMAELSFQNTRRCPDLAVLKLARQIEDIETTNEGQRRIVIVPRDLPRPGMLHSGLARLNSAIPNALWAVQADVAGPRSDQAFCDRMGVPTSGALSQVLERDDAGVVISVRLHGAIGAMLSGHPAIHLSYERKGYGAYEDLGLEAYVHDARNFDPDLVARQAADLQADPDPYWAHIRQASPRLRDDYRRLIGYIRRRLFAPGEMPAPAYATAAR